MFIVQIMYRRCNFNVTFSTQKLLDINKKAVWLNGLYCELVDLATVAQKGHTCKLKMLLQTKNITCKLKTGHAN